MGEGAGEEGAGGRREGVTMIETAETETTGGDLDRAAIDETETEAEAEVGAPKTEAEAGAVEEPLTTGDRMLEIEIMGVMWMIGMNELGWTVTRKGIPLQLDAVVMVAVVVAAVEMSHLWQPLLPPVIATSW